jgi:hypothetical protein
MAIALGVSCFANSRNAFPHWQSAMHIYTNPGKNLAQGRPRANGKMGPGHHSEGSNDPRFRRAPQGFLQRTDDSELRKPLSSMWVRGNRTLWSVFLLITSVCVLLNGCGDVELESLKTQQVDNSVTNPGTTTMDSSEPASNKELVLNVTIQHGHDDLDAYDLEYHYDRVLFCDKIGDHDAPANSIYAIAYYTVVNKGHSTGSFNTAKYIALETDGRIGFQADSEGKNALCMDRNLLRGAKVEFFLTQLQPGIPRNFATVFLLPKEQLDRHPYLIVCDSGVARKLPLFKGVAPVQNDEITSNSPKTPTATESPSAAQDSSIEGQSTPSTGTQDVSSAEQDDAPNVPSNPPATTAEARARSQMLLSHFANMAKNTDEGYKIAYGDFADSWKERQSLTDFADSNNGKWRIKPGSEKAIVSDSQIDEKHAQVDVRMGYFTDDARTLRLLLTKEDGFWKIISGTPGQR